MQEDFIQLFKETLDIEDKEVQITDQFKTYEEWDSIANLSVIAMIDAEYEVIIENSVFKEIETLQELWEAIEERR